MFSTQSCRNLYEVSFKNHITKHMGEHILAVALVVVQKNVS